MKGIRFTAMLSAVVLLSAFLLMGCGQSGGEEKTESSQQDQAEKEESADQQPTFEDGVYFAQENGFSEETGWKSMVTLEVEDGTIVEAEWNGAHKTAGNDKITRSESGNYGMVKHGDAQARWYEQAAKAEEFLLDKQDPSAITYSDNEGHTDAISGVSIHVVEFFDLAEKALDKGPVGYGKWEDGHYRAEEAEFDHGYKPYVDITVVSGRIVAAEWNAIPEEGEKKKKQASKDGDYGMVANSDAQSKWWNQAEKAEAYLLETQDPSEISYTEDGATDAISGVSITVKEFFELADKALEGAER